MKRKIDTKDLIGQRKKYLDQAMFIDWALAKGDISNITFSEDYFCYRDSGFYSGSTNQKILCEFKTRESRVPYSSQIIEKCKYDFLMKVNKNRPDILPLYISFYRTGRDYIAYEFDLLAIQEPLWTTQQHRTDATKLEKEDKVVAYLDNEYAERRIF